MSTFFLNAAFGLYVMANYWWYIPMVYLIEFIILRIACQKTDSSGAIALAVFIGNTASALIGLIVGFSISKGWLFHLFIPWRDWRIAETTNSQVLLVFSICFLLSSAIEFLLFKRFIIRTPNKKLLLYTILCNAITSTIGTLIYTWI